MSTPIPDDFREKMEQMLARVCNNEIDELEDILESVSGRIDFIADSATKQQVKERTEWAKQFIEEKKTES